jgi:hypothetical protein
MTRGTGAFPSTAASRYSLVGETLKVGALAACALGSRIAAAQRSMTWVFIRDGPNYILTNNATYSQIRSCAGHSAEDTRIAVRSPPDQPGPNATLEFLRYKTFISSVCRSYRLIVRESYEIQAGKYVQTQFLN